MYCQNCGENNPTGSVGCKKCGYSLDAIIAASSPTQPQTQVAYPYNYPYQRGNGQVPVTATVYAPPSPGTSGIPDVPIAPPPPVHTYGARAGKPCSAGLANLFEVLLPGMGFLYAGDAGGGVLILISTIVFVLIALLFSAALHGLAIIFLLVTLLTWFVVRLVFVNQVVNRRNAGKEMLKSATIAAFLEFFCAGMGCFYARKIGTGFALLAITCVAIVGAIFITYVLVLQAYQNFNNTPAGVIYNLCTKQPGCNPATLTGPDFTSVSICLIISSVILLIWMIGRMIAVTMTGRKPGYR